MNTACFGDTPFGITDYPLGEAYWPRLTETRRVAKVSLHVPSKLQKNSVYIYIYIEAHARKYKYILTQAIAAK